MNQEEAKQILDVHHFESGQVESDFPPEVIDALAIVRGDPELETWWNNRRHFDKTMCSALAEIKIPDNLHDRILADVQARVSADGSRVTGGQTDPGFPPGRVEPIRAEAGNRSRKVVILGSIAALLLVAGFLVKFLAFPPPVEFEGTEFSSVDKFRDDMAYFANSRFVLDYTSGRLEDARYWLEKQKWPAMASIPSEIARFEGIGCKGFDWGGHKVGLICFNNEHDQIVHLFIIDREVFKNLETARTPLQQMLVRQGLETGGWHDDRFVYCYVGSGPDVKIGNLLPAAGT